MGRKVEKLNSKKGHTYDGPMWTSSGRTELSRDHPNPPPNHLTSRIFNQSIPQLSRFGLTEAQPNPFPFLFELYRPRHAAQ